MAEGEFSQAFSSDFAADEMHSEIEIKQTSLPVGRYFTVEALTNAVLGAKETQKKEDWS